MTYFVCGMVERCFVEMPCQEESSSGEAQWKGAPYMGWVKLGEAGAFLTACPVKRV